MLTKGKPHQADDPAESLAVDVLLWIVGDEDRLFPFLATTGLDVEAVRAGAGDPAFLAGVLDYVAGHEPVLIACANALAVKPERIVTAWHRLSPAPDDEWM
ncbi:DUF3572 domain-containing protein [Methylobacterium sp. J-076]|uniref:DUF3572 domain-containing protein n=1 Tax=Methylobacterium sp. J-076 TaxID=2836655 RepID=UPI001FB93DAE|nr:DUF3572 domain-containing protein [Methylobacterium sp. J-076]MCJ2015018.1 DUF3572 domain-containing protein [Methylobacterium sp. J-076]